MWIAAKYQETYQVPKMSNLERLCDHAYKAEDIIYMEGRILEVTGFSLLLDPSPLCHLELLQNHAQLPQKDYSLACYLLEASAFEPTNLSLGEFFINEKKTRIISLTNSGEFNFDFVWKRQVNKYVTITAKCNR